MKNIAIMSAALCGALALSGCSIFSKEHGRALETLTPITDSTDEQLSQTLESILLEVQARQDALEDESASEASTVGGASE